MINAYYDFANNTCNMTGWTVANNDKSIILCDNSATCTAEEIMSAYQQFGIECVSRLTGVFSFALWDNKKEQLFVVRDRLGERPMYYAKMPTGIMFSTDLKDILSHIAYPAIRPHELAQPIRHNFPIDLQHTWIEQILRLRGGEYAIVDKNGARFHTYFQRNRKPSFTGSKQEAIEESMRLMRQSVKRCIEMSPGPVAVLLSGGIDSSSIAAFAKEIQQEVHVISAGYKGNQYTACDERPAAKRFAEEKGLIYHEVELDVDDFQSYLDELIPFLDEPCFDVNCMVQFALYKKAAEMGFKTILSGLGGDEQFYSYVDDHQMVRSMQLRNEFLHLYPVAKRRKEYVAFLLRNWKFLLWPTDSFQSSECKPTRWTYDLYKKFAASATLTMGCEEIRFGDIYVEHHFPQDTDILSIYDFTFSTFANTLCVYMANKLCAANGIEVRLPLLDPDLVCFLDTIPLKMKFDASCPKQFQKDIMSGILPEYILCAGKRAFEPPFEFIWKICDEYKYKRIKADYVFFNSMMADRMIDNLLK